MNRKEFLEHIHRNAEALYDKCAPHYWVDFCTTIPELHRNYMKEFIGLITPPTRVLLAACGAGRFDGLLLEAGFSVVGVDQADALLALAREHFPSGDYRKIYLQNLDFHADFDGVICMDSREPIPPDDYPGVLQAFGEALKPRGLLYFTADREEDPDFDVDYYFKKATAAGFPVVYGEVNDDASFQWAIQQPYLTGPESDVAVYHYYPSLQKIRDWIRQVGFLDLRDGEGDGFHHFLVRKV